MPSISSAPRAMYPVQNAYHWHLLCNRRGRRSPGHPRVGMTQETIKAGRYEKDQRESFTLIAPAMRPLSSFAPGRVLPRGAVLTGLLLASIGLPLPGQGPPVVVGVGPHEEYYLIMFGAQTVPANPRYSHSFAEF